MSQLSNENPLADMSRYLSACREDYDKCIDCVEHKHVVNGVVATTRMHHLRFDGNGEPMTKALAEYLYNSVIDYCIAARNRPAALLTTQQAAALTKEARKLFINPPTSAADPDRTGEAGEMLLYFLLEAVLGAPQMVAKIELKTNPHKESNGSDGIHMKWNAAEKLVEVYFGEAKLIQDIGAAMTSALKSVAAFHDAEMDRHEFKMVTKQFKYADSAIKDAVADLFKDGVPTGGVRIHHACLIGYNWTEYGPDPKTASTAVAADFQKRYSADGGRLHELLQGRFDQFARKHLRFEVFFLPFKSVQEFRDCFNKALN